MNKTPLILRVSPRLGLQRREEWDRRTMRRFNEEGPEGLADGREKNGKAPIGWRPSPCATGVESRTREHALCLDERAGS